MLRSARLAVLAFVGAAVCLAHGQTSPQKLSPKEIYAKCKDAVVKIETDKGTGTGFFYLEDNLIATCYHVIGDASKIEVKDTAGHTWKVDSVYFDKDLDAALLRVSGPPAKHLSSADPATVSVGDDLAVIGNPLGVLEQTLTTGVLSARRETKEVTLYQTSAAISPGSSGSPLLTSSGTVLGFISFTFTEGQSLNMAVGCSAMVGLLKKDAQPVSLFLESVSKEKQEEKNREAAPSASPAVSPTKAYVSVVNRINSAFQNWTITWLRTSTSVYPSDIDNKHLLGVANEFLESLGGEEIKQMMDTFDAKSAWINDGERTGLAKVLSIIDEEGRQLFDAEVEYHIALVNERIGEIRRAKSVFIDKDARLRNNIAVLINWGTDQKWFSADEYAKSVNTAATLSGFDFEPKTFVIPDPLFPYRTQIGFSSGKPFYTADVILGVRLKKDSDFLTVKSWADFSIFYRSLPAGKSDLVIRINRDGNIRNLEVGVKRDNPAGEN